MFLSFLFLPVKIVNRSKIESLSSSCVILYFVLICHSNFRSFGSMTNYNLTDSFASLSDALKFVSFTSGLFINETFMLPSTSSKWSSIISVIPLILGSIGLIFNLMALFIFPTSKTFRQSSFHCYIYAFVTVNSVSIIS